MDGPLACGALAGLGAAAVGLLVVAALIGLAWIVEPAVGGSVLGPARLTALGWLLGHGADVETAGLRIAVTPLAVTALAGGCCWYAGGWAGRRAEVDSLREVSATTAGLACSYAIAGVVVALTGSTAGAGIAVGSAVPGVLGLSAVAGAGGLLRTVGHGRLLHDRMGFPSRAVVSGACAGGAVLAAGGVGMLGAAVAVDRAGFAALTEVLAPGWSAGLGLFVFSLILVPNAALYAVAVLLGPGFALGAGTTVSAFGVTLAAVPGLPLAAALPDQPAVPLGVLAGLAVPGLCGLVVGAVVARRLDEPDHLDRDACVGPLAAGGWAAVAGLVLSLVVGGTQWMAGGSLGTGALAVIGAPPLATAAAAAGFLVLPAALCAGLLRRRQVAQR